MENDSGKNQNTIETAKGELFSRFITYVIMPLAFFGLAILFGNQMFPGPVTNLVDDFLLLMLPIIAILSALYIKVKLNHIQKDCCDKQ